VKNLNKLIFFSFRPNKQIFQINNYFHDGFVSDERKSKQFFSSFMYLCHKNIIHECDAES